MAAAAPGESSQSGSKTVPVPLHSHHEGSTRLVGYRVNMKPLTRLDHHCNLRTDKQGKVNFRGPNLSPVQQSSLIKKFTTVTDVY